MNIYVHIPFCRARCAYCTFLSCDNLGSQKPYFEALANEILHRSKQFKGTPVETIYFGGGTPSLVDEVEIKDILSLLSESFKIAENVEITLEANPEDLSEEKLLEYKNIGINRLSIGVQTLNDEVRKSMGRRLSSAQVTEIIRTSQKYFPDLGLDLIAGLPGDQTSSFIEGIVKLEAMGVKHLSVYDLEIKNGSKICSDPKKFSLLSDPNREKFLARTWLTLDNLGYRQYEISNFAKEDLSSRHNLDFWHGKDYLGLGLGSSSRYGDRITQNTGNMMKYLAGKWEDAVETLSDIESAELELILSLRLDVPILAAIKNYQRVSKCDMATRLGQAKELGLIDDSYFVTKNGKLLYNKLVELLLV